MRAVKLAMAVVLGILALSVVGAAGAQAEESEWMIEEEDFPELKLKEEKLSLSGAGAYVLSVPAKKTTIECSALEASGKLLEAGKDELKISLSKCTVAEFKACIVSEPIVIEAKTEAVLAGESYYDKIEPLKKESPLTNVKFKKETECVLPLENEVAGSIAAEISSGELTKQSLKFSEKISKAVNESLKAEEEAEINLTYGKVSKSPAFLSGTLLEELGGPNKGKKWTQAEFTRICEMQAAPNSSRCPGGNYYPANELIELKSEVEMKFGYGPEFTCTGWTLEGMTLSAGGRPLRGTFLNSQFTNCAAGSCTVETPLIGVDGFYFYFDHRLLSYLVIPHLVVKITCGGLEPCAYKVDNPWFATSGGEPARFATFSRQNLAILVGQPAACQATGFWSGPPFPPLPGPLKLEMLAPAKLYITGR